MRKLSYLLFSIVIAYSCNGQTKSNETKNLNKEFKSFGERIDPDSPKNVANMMSVYQSMSTSDTTGIKLKAKVNNVCQAKGCWMTLDLGNGNEMMVKFKDYGFFMPKDISGKEVIVNGKAYISEVSVEEQKHYAEDAGKSESEISKITEPKRTYLFEADGVLLK